MPNYLLAIICEHCKLNTYEQSKAYNLEKQFFRVTTSNVFFRVGDKIWSYRGQVKIVSNNFEAQEIF